MNKELSWRKWKQPLGKSPCHHVRARAGAHTNLMTKQMFDQISTSCTKDHLDPINLMSTIRRVTKVTLTFTTSLQV